MNEEEENIIKRLVKEDNERRKKKIDESIRSWNQLYGKTIEDLDRGVKYTLKCPWKIGDTWFLRTVDDEYINIKNLRAFRIIREKV